MKNTPARVFRPVPPRRNNALAALGVAAVFAIPFLLWIISWFTAPHPIRYELDNQMLRVHTGARYKDSVKTLQLGRLEQVEAVRLRNREMRFGTEKTNYCVGFFYYPTLGDVWQATDCSDDGVLIRVGGETIPVVVTPTDRESFMATMVSPRPATFPTATKPVSLALPTFLLLCLFCWPVAVALGVSLFVAPARLRYAVSDGTLTVRTLFGSHSYPLSGARVRPHSPLVGERQSGLGIGGTYAGSWVLDTAPTNVFATSLDGGILIEHDQRLFVTPADGAAFVDAVKAEGAQSPPQR